jgi:hypothetical protein
MFVENFERDLRFSAPAPGNHRRCLALTGNRRKYGHRVERRGNQLRSKINNGHGDRCVQRPYRHLPAEAVPPAAEA